MPVDKMNVWKFDVGIEEILSSKELREFFLPDETKPILPSEEQVSRRLDNILHLPSFETYLLESIKPKVFDKEILIPTKYRALVSDSLRILQSMSEEKDLSPEEVQLLGKASEVFREEMELFDTLSLFSNVLLKA